jgi:hypothetical protein
MPPRLLNKLEAMKPFLRSACRKFWDRVVGIDLTLATVGATLESVLVTHTGNRVVGIDVTLATGTLSRYSRCS